MSSANKTHSSGYDPSFQKNEDYGEKTIPPSSSADVTKRANDEKQPAARTDDEKAHYITRIKLALVMLAMTMVGFVILLDMSIISTVR